MKLNSKLTTTAAVVLLLGACSSYQTPKTESISQAIDLSRFETFSVGVQGESNDTAFGPLWRDRVFEHLVDEFVKTGYSFRDNGTADFQVVFTTIVRDEDVIFSTDYSQPSQQIIVKESQTVTPSGHLVRTDRETEIITTYKATPISLESLHRLYVIDIVDTDTDVLLWRGYVKSDDIELEDAKAVEDHIERIVDKLPRS